MKVLDLDIETAPNTVFTWGLFNQNIGINQIVTPGFTMCWAARWADSKETMFSCRYMHGKEVMLLRIHKLLDEADAVVHWNGRNFDIPILNTEFVKAGMEPPTPYHQIDLLQTARRRFKATSNKMDFWAQFLGVGKKVPHKGFELWEECMKGDYDAWKTMKKYNIQDVALLRDLYNKLLPWIQDHPNAALYDYDPDVTPVECCPNCGSTNLYKKGMEHLKTLSYQRYKCRDCGTPIRGRSTVLPLDKRRAILTQSKL